MSIPVAKQYILDFEQLGFGMFVHWGLYSQVGKGEWHHYHKQRDKYLEECAKKGIVPEEKIPFKDRQLTDEYKSLINTFTAEDFDAEKLVLTAKNTGCKYITLTTRHHEGFSLFDTCGLNDFDAPHSPAKRDLIREFVDACRKHDIIPFFYMATHDWYHPATFNDFDAFLDYLNKSVEILCTNYGKIGGFWFDGNWSQPDADWKEDELYKVIRKHQPEAMIINNTGMAARGYIGNPEIDSVTFENGRPTPLNREGMPKYIAGEMCHTINDHWGIGEFDYNYKSPKELIENLCNCRKVGANYLLNIGPEGQGKVNDYQARLMELIGNWMKLNGEAIYNGRPYASYSVGKNFILKSYDGKSLYLFVFDLGIEGSANVTVGGKYFGSYSFGNVTDKVSSIEWMDNGEALKFIQGEDMLCVNFTGYPYGKSLGVRVAKAVIEK
ncbi:MAG: alpha-L-fucosidase [Clostridia bacterium]|nr:alpha-L-fucosidase [Clostridia bacterium]